jgi:uncharacterized protein YdaU (DUF1376 family)
MSLPYFPMFPTDFEAKTSHLTLAEDGAYNRLLRICWMTQGCSIPDDAAWIMRRLRVDQAAYDEVVKVVIDEFFDSQKGRLSNAKLTRIFLTTNEAHGKRVSAGSKGGKAKSLQANKKDSSNAVAMPKQLEPEPEPEPKKEDTSVSLRKKRGERLAEDWFLPMDWGQWAVTEGWTSEQVKAEAEKFKDYWISKPGAAAVKLDWQATWRNWIRNSNGKSTGTNAGRNSGRPNPHRSLLAAFGANATDDDGAGSEPSGNMRDVTPASTEELDGWTDSNPSSAFLRFGS